MGIEEFLTTKHTKYTKGRKSFLTTKGTKNAKERKRAAVQPFRRDGTWIRKIRKSANPFASFRNLLIVLFSLFSYSD